MKDYKQTCQHKHLLKRSVNSPHPFLCAAKLSALCGVDESTLPETFDIRNRLDVIHNQRDFGSCYAFGGCTSMEVDYYNQTGQKIHFSPLFLAAMTRLLAGTLSQDCGATPDEMIKAATLCGMVPDSAYSYDKLFQNPHIYYETPPDSVKDQALNYQLINHYQIINSDKALTYLKLALAAGMCPSIALTMHQSFESNDVAYSGIIPIPTANDPVIGGHMMNIVGWKPKWTLVRNSYGSKWGQFGYCWIPNEYFLSEDFQEARVCTRMEVGKPAIGQ